MKDASGELSMTVVVIVAAVAIIGLLTAFMEPMGETIQEKWTDMLGTMVSPVVDVLK